MVSSTLELASNVLEDGDGSEYLRVHEFTDDVEAHDDARTDELYSEFEADVDRIAAELSGKYGPPAATGGRDTEDHELVQLGGVIRFAMWQVEGHVLYIAASHEDRGLPVLLMLGAAPGRAA